MQSMTEIARETAAAVEHDNVLYSSISERVVVYGFCDANLSQLFFSPVQIISLNVILFHVLILQSVKKGFLFEGVGETKS